MPMLQSTGLGASTVQAAAQTAAPTTAQAPANSQYKNVGYFASWGIYGRNYQVKDIDASKLTHINYAFFDVCWNGIHGNPSPSADNPNSTTWKCTDPAVPLQRGNVPNGAIVVGEPWADVTKSYPGDTWSDCEAGKCGNIGELKRLKQKNPHLKTLFSIGGWTWSNRFSDVAANEQYRINFAKSAVDAVRTYGFDGVDIDWEYPGVETIPGNSYSPNDKINFTKLLEETRRHLDEAGRVDGKHYLLTIATGASQTYIDNTEMAKVNAIVDFINIMTYDFHGGSFIETTNNNAALLNDTRDPSAAKKFYVDGAIDIYQRAGVDLNKIVLGLAFYGRGWSNCAPGPNGDGLYQKCVKNDAGNWAPKGTWDDFTTKKPTGVFDYGDIVGNYLNKNGYTRYWNDQAKVPYLYNPTTKTYISYDDEQSIGLKTDYIKTKGLGGGMIWELDSDCRTTTRFACTGATLLNKVAADLGINGSAPDITPPSVPTGVAATTVGDKSVALKWYPSADNFAVTGYEVYTNGQLATTVTGPTATVTGLTPNTSYAFTVKAKDAAGNVSAASQPLSVKTLAKPLQDVIAPTVPTNVSVTSATYDSVSLTWTASTDNVAVTGYDVYSNGQLATTVTGTATSVTGLAGNTTYTFTIVAKDAAGNGSTASAPVTAKTAEKPGSTSGAFTFVAKSTWGDSFDFSAAIKNNGTTPLTNWRVEFDYAGKITSVFDAKIVSHIGTRYIIESNGWNGTIPAGGSVTFGGAGQGSATASPTNVVIKSHN
ncbi:fibronectin type III domain-containing protein [Paenibacillus sp. 481]|nr:fibronectin type III domain-containing protein [Paenibacillus sp. 481]